LIIYINFKFTLIIYYQVIDYLQSRYVVIINNHDLVLIIYISVFIIIYNTSIIINNYVVQFVLFTKTV
jgi:hypothetical protein